MKANSLSNILAIGHRGCRDLRPENTLAGFKYALDLGVDAVECDVHLTRDGKIIVYHDYFLNLDLTRTFAGTWIQPSDQPLSKQTYVELGSYKLGQIKPFTEYSQKHPNVKTVDDEPIPTLQEVIDLVKKYPGKRLLIEIKTSPFKPEESSDSQAIVKAVLQEIQKAGFQNNCEILAFDWNVLEIVKQLFPTIKVSFNHFAQEETNSLWFGGHDLKDYNNSPAELIKRLGGSTWSAHYENLTQESVDHAHDLGLDVYAWTVNSEQDMNRMARLGVDAIITDRPDLLLNLLRD